MKIRLDIFEGPLDLLLYLIKKEHLSIHDITITKVVDQYLQYLDLMKVFDINIASEYLVTAATLISIKSKMLLPKPELEEDIEEDDPRLDLINKLIEYEKFKEAAEFLKSKELDRKKYVSRPQINYNFEDGAYIEASIFDLISAFKSALKEVPPDIFFEIIKDEHTVEEKIHDIVRLVLDNKKIYLNDLFSRARSKVEIVVTFLAILELIKSREIVALQDSLFGPVSLARRTETAVQVA
ncbi:MAG: segregation/condensation protein A [Candidatus Omnitrophica bacterium]|nr:segregation/condensation protein A [Candidatus Omnitrophota bacterium]MDD5080477.1 segregation/condensation protein A [Candidatus Omnitrophota bacterium]MDD5440737.1 segregation/condensation protein A [Candidatus Omnitrophota bacterium]